MRAAIVLTFADPTLSAARDALFLADIEVLPDAAYGRISQTQTSAARRGYPELR